MLIFFTSLIASHSHLAAEDHAIAMPRLKSPFLRGLRLLVRSGLAPKRTRQRIQRRYAHGFEVFRVRRQHRQILEFRHRSM